MVRILFLGTPNFVEPVKKTLKENFKLVEKVEDSNLIVVASYGRILSKDEIKIPKYGAINIHPSALPKFRGPSPLQTQILEGVSKSAITFIKMDEEIDHGPIIESVQFEILTEDTFESAAARAFKIAALALPKIISNYIKGQIKLSVQDDSKATFTQHLTKENGYLDFKDLKSSIINNKQSLRSSDLKSLDRRIRAFYPWPGVWFQTILNGKKVIIKLLPERKIQVEGKKPTNYKDFVNGYSEGKKILSTLKLLN